MTVKHKLTSTVSQVSDEKESPKGFLASTNSVLSHSKPGRRDFPEVLSQ